jgi:hypothetical protein
MVVGARNVAVQLAEDFLVRSESSNNANIRDLPNAVFLHPLIQHTSHEVVRTPVAAIVSRVIVFVRARAEYRRLL